MRRLAFSTSLSNYSYENSLKKFSLESLNIRRIKFDLIYIYKIVYGFVDIDCCKFFDFSLNLNITRTNGLKLKLPICRTNLRLNSFPNRVINIWNKLPSDVVCTPTISIFKKRLSTELICRIINILPIK